MASRIIGISAVGTETVMPMSLFIIAIIQTGGVQAAQTILTAATTFMRLDCHTIPFLELGHIGSDGDHGASEFMPRDEFAEFGISFPTFGNDGRIASADGNRMNFDQRLANSERRHGYFDDPQITKIE